MLEVQAIHGVKLRAGDFDTAWNALIDWWSKRTVKEERRESIAAMLLAVTDDRRGSAVRFAAAGDGSPVAGRRLEADPKAGILRRSSHGRRASKPPRMPSFCEDEEMRESFAASFNKGGGSHPGVDAADEAWESSEAERLKMSAGSGAVQPGIDTEEEFEPPRVYEDVSRRYRGPGLAISRAVGDMNARSCGVVATPEVSSMQLQPSDCFLILASDGVWEFISSAEAVEIVRPFFEAEEPASVACTYLIAKAAYKWREVEGDYRDDISAIVVYLPLFDD